MDGQYDHVAASLRLEKLAIDRHNSSHSDTQLSRMYSVASRYEAVNTGRNWRLVQKNTNEEIVVSFQGIVYKKDLPPFEDRLGKKSNHIKFLRQSLSITGLNTATFGKVVDAILDVHATLGRAVGINNVQACGMISQVDNIHVCELSNRYLTSRGNGGNLEDEIPLSTDIDPHGYLAEAALSAGLYHSEENLVAYFEREGTTDGNYTYKTAKPSIFGIGDIVEVQASFVMFRMKDKKYKSAMTLRSIALLDGQFTQARIRNLIKGQISASYKPSALKRKIGYGEEEISATRAKISKMEIDGGSNSPTEGGQDSDQDHFQDPETE